MREKEPSRKPLSKEMVIWNKQLDGYMAGEVMDRFDIDTPQARDEAYQLTHEFLFSKKTPTTEHNVFTAFRTFEKEADKRSKVGEGD